MLNIFLTIFNSLFFCYLLKLKLDIYQMSISLDKEKDNLLHLIDNLSNSNQILDKQIRKQVELLTSLQENINETCPTDLWILPYVEYITFGGIALCLLCLLFFPNSNAFGPSSSLSDSLDENIINNLQSVTQNGLRLSETEHEIILISVEKALRKALETPELLGILTYF